MNCKKIALRLAVAALVAAAAENGVALAKGREPPKPGSAGSSAGEMVRLPGGTYTMGATKRTVTLQPFLIDVMEVTVTGYEKCVKAGKCSAGDSGEYCNGGKTKSANQPANCVDWNQATAYCAWAGKRLLTEEEWEWAARGAERGTTYPWGNDDPGSQLCWSGGNVMRFDRGLGTCTVGSYPRGDSPQEVKDLAGNVWEWTSSSEGVDRVVRGGAWLTVGAPSVSAAGRRMYGPASRHNFLGFRCARSV